jgi:hypothetical protein
MDLLGALRRLGDRLGIIELGSAPEKPRAPVKIQTRTITLDELTSKIKMEGVRELADLSTELSVSFEEIYNAAGVKDTTAGWNVERLQELLTSERLRGMDRAAVQRETLGVLAAEKVDPADLVKGAVLRDQALDAFESVISKKKQERQGIRERRLSELSAEIAALENERARIKQTIADEEQRWNDWRQRKRRREREIANAVGFLIDTPVITIDET